MDGLSWAIKKIMLLIILLGFITYSFATSTNQHNHLTKTHLAKKEIALHENHHKKRHHHSIKKHHLHTKKQSAHHTAAAAAKQPTLIQKHNITISTLPVYLLSSIEKNLVSFVRNTMTTLQYSVYKLGGTHIDTSHGVYIVDCSSYVDHVLKSIYPQAYSSLVASIGSEKPTSDDFYHYFINLSTHAKHWNTIEDVEELRPGDILVFRYKNSLGYERGGHVMIVMDKPIRHGDTFSVRVTDSASGGHSKDTRQPRSSGIGIGTLVLKVNPRTYQPYAYAWKIGSRWQSNVSFAMARPLGLETA
ncbi:MAG: hypothetical protein JO149_09430 [Gammaproteobacteria bacterium]|nr:hypothetical protein [Gammaproteobacteria bacterium]